MNDECMLATTSQTSNGYARIGVKIDGVWRMRAFHREMYLAYKGDIPDKYVIDHLCRTRCCINVDHLEAVTNEENIRRGDRPSYYTDTCNKGHVLADVGYHLFKGNRKACKECRKLSMRAYRRRLKAHATT